MRRLIGTILCLQLVIASSGCALCYTPYDNHYNAFGGVVERHDRVQGRVGSILSDPSLQYVEGETLGEQSTEADLYPLNEEEPQLESIEPQERPSDVDI